MGNDGGHMEGSGGGLVALGAASEAQQEEPRAMGTYS
jgi:hypothetical protein